MAQGFSVRPYGTLNQQPPYAATTDGLLPAVNATYPADQVLPANFPTTNINMWSINPGVKMAGGVFCYGVIEIPANGLTQLFSTKYVVKEDITTLTTLRG